jgi:hypothetical protein
VLFLDLDTKGLISLSFQPPYSLILNEVEGRVLAKLWKLETSPTPSEKYNPYIISLTEFSLMISKEIYC